LQVYFMISVCVSSLPKYICSGGEFGQPTKKPHDEELFHLCGFEVILFTFL
jgi:hypothetical protein